MKYLPLILVSALGAGLAFWFFRRKDPANVEAYFDRERAASASAAASSQRQWDARAWFPAAAVGYRPLVDTYETPGKGGWGQRLFQWGPRSPIVGQ